MKLRFPGVFAVNRELCRLRYFSPADCYTIALDANGFPRISYCSVKYIDWYQLRYAYQDASGWHVQTVDKSYYWVSGSLGDYNSLAVDARGHAHISYYGRGTLMYAYQGVGGWVIQAVGGAGNWVTDTSLDLDGNGFARISYFDSDDGNLMLAAYHSSTPLWSEIFLPVVQR